MSTDEQVQLEEWLRASADVEEAAALTAQLVSIRSYPG